MRVEYVTVTDISKMGMMAGPDQPVPKILSNTMGIKLIYHGGVRSVEWYKRIGINRVF